VTENEIAELIVEAAFRVHRGLGPGLLESVNEVALAWELTRLGLRVERQRPIPVVYAGIHFDIGFRADLFVEQKVIVELKAVEKSPPVHKRTTLTHARLAGARLGLLINFGEAYLKNGITRLANGLPDE
jgi:GxxExxY protein